MSSLSLPHRLTSPVLFLHRASRHALFSINAVPLRDTSHVSRVTLCRFRGTSYYIGVISCLVTSPSARARAIPLRCRPAKDGAGSRSFLFPVSPSRIALQRFSYLIHIAVASYIAPRGKSTNRTVKTKHTSNKTENMEILRQQVSRRFIIAPDAIKCRYFNGRASVAGRIVATRQTQVRDSRDYPPRIFPSIA